MQNPQTAARSSSRPDPTAGPALAAGPITLETTDPSEFEVALRPWELLCRPIDAGDFRHRVTLFAGSELLLYHETYDLGVHLTGMTPAGMLVLSVPTFSGGETNFWGEDGSERRLPCVQPGVAEATLAAGYRQRVVGLPLDTLYGVVSPGIRERLERICLQHQIGCSPVARERLGRWIGDTLERLGRRPDLARSRAYEARLLEEFVTLLVGLVEGDLESGNEYRTAASRRGFERALAFIRGAPMSDIRLSRLCGVSGVSERSLQYAFQESLGMSPKAFMTARRLHAARQALLACSPETTRVSEVAMQHGFFELGRFAVTYRKHFGECPSETLRRVR